MRSKIFGLKAKQAGDALVNATSEAAVENKKQLNRIANDYEQAAKDIENPDDIVALMSVARIVNVFDLQE